MSNGNVQDTPMMSRKKLNPADSELIRDLYFKVKGASYFLLKRLHEADSNLRWTTFRKELKNQVGVQNNEWKLNEQLRTLSMEKCGKDLEKYMLRFQSIINKLPPMDEKRKVNEFTKGLHRNMIAHFICHTARKKELSEAIVQAWIVYDAYIKVIKPSSNQNGFNGNRFRSSKQFQQNETFL